MTDTRIFQIDKNNGNTYELKSSSAALEKELQTLIEKNLDTLLSISFLESEYSTGKKHRGRIDTLGIDENGCPVIIEYKRSVKENVINQGLFYLDWLMDHKAEFELLVLKKLGKETADNIEWGNPRLVCIAGDFTRYDEHAVQQMNRNIELVRYRYYEQSLLLLELVNSVEVIDTTGNGFDNTNRTKKTSSSKTFSEYLSQCDAETQNLYNDLKVFIESLGDDVQVKILKHYIAFKRLKNFACVEVHPQTRSILVYVKINPNDFPVEQEGFTRDVRNIGHYGTGDLEIRIHSHDDLSKAEELIQKSYDLS